MEGVCPITKTTSEGFYGRCDVCSVLYENETASIKHLMSLMHHKRYDAAQRSLGFLVSHFCPVCGIGGMRDINEWSAHIQLTSHAKNYENFMRIATAQKIDLKRQHSDKKIRKKDNKVKPLEGNTGGTLQSQNFSKTFGKADSLSNNPNSLSHLMLNEHQYNCCQSYRAYDPPQAFSQSPFIYSRHGLYMQPNHHGCEAPVFQETFQHQNRNQVMNCSQGWYGGHFGRNFGGLYQPPSLPVSSEQNINQVGLNSQFQVQSQKIEPVSVTTIDLCEPPKEALRELESVKTARFALPDTFSKMHEVWKISEALEKITQQQHTINNYIQQLKSIRHQKNVEKIHLLQQHATLLRELGQSDSWNNLDSSDSSSKETGRGNCVTSERRSTRFEESATSMSVGCSTLAESTQSTHEVLCANETVAGPLNLDNSGPSLGSRPMGALVATNSSLPFESNEPLASHLNEALEVDTVDDNDCVLAPSEESPSSILPPRRRSARRGQKRTTSRRRSTVGSRKSRRSTKKKNPPAASSAIDNDKQKTIESPDRESVQPQAQPEMDLERLRQIREIINNPASLRYTFDELDKLTEAINTSIKSFETGLSTTTKPP